MTKINYLFIFNLIAIFLTITPSSTLIFAANDEDFNEDELPVVKKSVCWSNGDCYDGEYESNNRTGKGVYTWANGDRYEGEFYEGKRDGNGTYIWANGDRYVGDYLEDKRDGEGTYTWANGDQFKGEFLEGKRGQGKMVRAKITPKQSEPELTLQSATSISTSKVTLTKPIDEFEQLENEINTVSTAQEIEVEKTKLESKKLEQSTDTEENQTIADTESMKDSSSKSAATTALVPTDSETLKEEVNLIPEDFNDQLEEDSATELAKTIDKDSSDDDFTLDHLTKTDKELTAQESTKAPELGEKIAPTVTTDDEKPTPARTETIAKEEKAAIPEQNLTIAKLEDKPVKSITATAKIVADQSLLERQDNGSSDTNLPSEPTFKWPNGDSYEGKYVNNERTGKGTYVWANGDNYTGDFMAGKRHGVGVYVWANGDRYEGKYVNDKRHGRGTYVWANGDRYEGDFFKNQRHGKGKLTWADGEIYEGAFAEGERTGIGVYISSGGDRYEGYFEEGKRSGKGILILANRQPKQLEFENELYTLDVLEFKQGRLVSAAAINQIEDNTNQEGENTDEIHHDGDELPNDNKYNDKSYDPFLDDEETNDHHKLPND
jgi:hypothetical protein